MDVVAIGGGARLALGPAREWLRMRLAAGREGLALAHSGPRAGYRTPEEQDALAARLGPYGKGGLVAPVGRSRHQLGLALDLSNVDPSTDNFDAQVREWLLVNGPRFGWYPIGSTFRTRPEPWHFEWKPPTGPP